MPTDFTGIPQWRDTITGPANADTVTGPSVSDMGTLEADRTQWLKQGIQLYHDTPILGLGHSGTPVTQEDSYYVAKLTLTVPLSKVIVVQHLSLVVTEDGYCDVYPALFDAADTLLETGVPVRIAADLTLQQLVIVAGFTELPPGDYSFGLRATRENVGAKFFSTGQVITAVTVIPIVEVPT